MSYPNRRFSSHYDLKGINDYRSYAPPPQRSSFSYRQSPFSPRTIPYSSSVTFAPSPPTSTTSSSISNSNTQNQIAQLAVATAATTALESSVKAAALPSPITDVLQAEVDYNVNEIDNIMICKGKIIEIQSGDLSSKYGLISRCMFINNLLKVANLSETHLNSDPLFLPDQSKAIIKFNSMKDAEEFINSHNCKYRIVLQNAKTPNDSELSSSKSNFNNTSKSNISFNNNDDNHAKFNNEIPIKKENSSFTAAVSEIKIEQNSSKINRSGDSKVKASASNEASRSLIINEPISGQTTFSLTLSDESKTHSSSENKNESLYDNNFNDPYKFESNVDSFNDEEANANDNSLVLKSKQIEGYETLTIRAKLKQRVGPNRTKHVTLKDIDSIMRNVVTVVQNEFMKRFPSATSANNTISITDGTEADSFNNTS